MWASGDGSEMKWIALLVIVAFAATIAVIFVYAARRWKSGTEKLRARLDLARRPIGTKTYDPSELIGLPEPVQRYFRATLSGGQQVVAAVNMEHSGTFNQSDAVVFLMRSEKSNHQNAIYILLYQGPWLQEEPRRPHAQRPALPDGRAAGAGLSSGALAYRCDMAAEL